jgi:hypothetical protein
MAQKSFQNSGPAKGTHTRPQRIRLKEKGSAGPCVP